MKTRTPARGFTLIELLITIVVISLLTTIALPSYREHVRKSRRAEAQAFLLAVAAKQQQFLVDTRAYAANLTTIAIPTPANVSAAYDLVLAAENSTAPTFSLSAVPKVGTDQPSERCGALAIDQTGAKTAAINGCW